MKGNISYYYGLEKKEDTMEKSTLSNTEFFEKS